MKGFFCMLAASALLPLATQAESKPTIPPLHNLTVKQDNIIFEVTSHGCSKDTDFKLRVDDGPRITLLRTRPDFCKRAPMVFRVIRTLSGAGLSLQTPFAVNNPFTPPPSKGNARSEKLPSK